MLFATIYLAYTGGIGGWVTQPSYDLIVGAILTLIALILILLLGCTPKSGPAPWDEEDEDDQFYD